MIQLAIHDARSLHPTRPAGFLAFLTPKAGSSDDPGRMLTPANTSLEETSSHEGIRAEDAVYYALAAVKIYTASVAMHLSDERRRKLFGQLDKLHAVEEWEAGDRPLDQRSFPSVLRLMLLLRPAKWPSLGLSQAGNLLAVWGSAKDRVTLEFLPQDHLRWTASYRPSEQEQVRTAGEGPAWEITRWLAGFDPGHWFGDAR